MMKENRRHVVNKILDCFGLRPRNDGALMLLFLFLILTLSACSFHVRSKQDMPPELKTLSIENPDKRSNLTPLLSENLKELGVNVVNSENGNSPVILSILNENFSQSKAILGTAQQVNNISLYYTVTYALKDKNQKLIIPSQTLTTSTSYFQNANQILGDTNLIPSLQQELMRNMVNQLLSHLAARKVQHALSA
jgi:LPS-assembly lipoprotein